MKKYPPPPTVGGPKDKSVVGNPEEISKPL